MLVSLAIGAMVGALAYTAYGAGDLGWSLRAARELWAGADPYAHPYNAGSIPYPLPAALIVMPLAWLPDRVAGAVFSAVSAGLLAYGSSRESWRGLLVFLSAPYWLALGWTQWSPLIAASAGLPVLAGLLVVVKPQIALPVALARLAPSTVLAGLVIGLVSLIVMPLWPWRWLSQVGEYRRFVPLLTPAGPLLALALALHAPAWREPRTQIMLYAVLMPQRAAYDAVVLWTSLPPTPLAALATLASWFTVFMPGGEGAAVSLAIYLPIILTSAPWERWQTIWSN